MAMRGWLWPLLLASSQPARMIGLKGQYRQMVFEHSSYMYSMYDKREKLNFFYCGSKETELG
jgi:hypothetical protein